MTINYGEIKVPTSWDEVSVKQYIDISRLNKEDKSPELIDMMPILINKDKDYVMSLPLEFLDKILEKLTFITKEPDVKPSNEIKIGKDTYVINYQEKLKVGEYLAADAAIKEDDKNIAKLLAILCRKKDELFDTDFTTNLLNDRIKMYEEQPITKVLPLFFFYAGTLQSLTESFYLVFKYKGKHKPHSREYREFGERWGNFKTYFQICDEDPEKIRKNYQQNLEEYLTLLSYLIDKAEVDDAEMEWQNNRKKLKNR